MAKLSFWTIESMRNHILYGNSIEWFFKDYFLQVAVPIKGIDYKFTTDKDKGFAFAAMQM